MKALLEMSNEELWQLFPIVLKPHSPAWASWFAGEKCVLESALDDTGVFRISHVGSTAVPGLVAKPTVDILLEVQPDYGEAALQTHVEAAGYLLNRLAHKPPPHLMGMKGYTPAGFAERVFHLHVRYPGDWPEPYFRDYLCDHPDVAAAYAALQADLRQRYEHDRDAYTAEKAAFVQRYSELARRAYPGRYAPQDAAGDIGA